MIHRTRNRLVLAAAFLAATLGFGQQAAAPPKAHRIVIEITAEPAAQWESLLNTTENVKRAFAPEPVEIMVIVHGRALSMLRKTNEPQASRMQSLSKSGVTFAACRNSMRRFQVEKTDLFDFATTVDSGVAEVVRRQEAGWSYVKSGS